MNVEFSVISSGVEFFSSTVHNGGLGDVPFGDFIPSGLEIYTPKAYREDMSLFAAISSSSIVFMPYVVEGPSSGTPVIFSGFIQKGFTEIFESEIDQTDREISFDTTILSEAEVYSPAFGPILEPPFFLNPSSVFSPELFNGIILGEPIGSSVSFFSHFIEGINEIDFAFTTPLSSGVDVYQPNIEPGPMDIEFGGLIPERLFIYRPALKIQRNFPVTFKRAESPLGGDIVQENIFSGTDYSPVLDTLEYDNISDFRYSFARGVIPNYIPSTDALFSKTFYRGIYVKNDSPFETKSGVTFWVDGGQSYRVQNALVDKTVQESRPIYEAEKALYSAEISIEEEDEFVFGGSSRTSLFGQLRVSYLISNTRILYPFNEDGVGLGINLASQRFIPGNQKSSLPDLNSGDYVGIYLKVEAKFSPDFPIKTDYSFFHLSYNGEDSGLYEMYPSQLRSNGGLVQLMLPSVSLRVSTDYDRINSYLSTETERLYNRYPPFFTQLEDVSR